MKITAAMLAENGACSSAVEEFRTVFGEEAEVTDENIIEALGNDTLASNNSWLGDHLLNEDGQEEWNVRLADRPGHTGWKAGPDCPGCIAQLRIFAELFKQERYRK